MATEPSDAFDELGMPQPEAIDVRRPVWQYVILGLGAMAMTGLIVFVLLVVVPAVVQRLIDIGPYLFPGDPAGSTE